MIRFADFELSAAEKALRKGSATLALRERAFAVLLALVEQAGQVVSKRALCARAWPERDVDENNLQVEILGLRRLLGKGAIVTAPGRGYQFTLRVETVPDVQDEAAPLVGRDVDLCALEALLAPGTLVTLTGEGGIGKTRLAAAVAQRRVAAARGTALVVAFDTAAGGEPPWRKLAAALQLAPAPGQDGAALLRAALRQRNLLLVFDDCDEAVQEIALLAAAILEECPGVSLLATSREVLRVSGERVYRLGPLGLGAGNDADPDVVAAAPAVADAGADAFAPAETDAGADVTTDCAAVRVFLDAYAASEPGASATPAPAAVRAICRQLDGNPLAIRIAARCAQEIGVAALQRSLARRLDLLVYADPAIPQRHQSLRAALDWSTQRLSEFEQHVFCALATLPQPFTLAQLPALPGPGAPDPWVAMEALARLVDKSLVGSDRADPPNFRLSASAQFLAREMAARRRPPTTFADPAPRTGLPAR